MNSDTYTEKLNAFNPLSAGLKAYIDTIAEKTDYKKGEALFLARYKNIFFPLVKSGSIKLFAVNRETDQEAFFGTYGTNDFLYHFAKLNHVSKYELYAEFLEDSSIVAISEKHFSNVMKLFSDASHLNLIYTSFHFNILFGLLIDKAENS